MAEKVTCVTCASETPTLEINSTDLENQAHDEHQPRNVDSLGNIVRVREDTASDFVSWKTWLVITVIARGQFDNHV